MHLSRRIFLVIEGVDSFLRSRDREFWRLSDFSDEIPYEDIFSI